MVIEGILVRPQDPILKFMNEGMVSIVLSIIAFLGIGITAWFTYKGTKATADIEGLKQKIIELEMENKILRKMITDCNEKIESK